MVAMEIATSVPVYDVVDSDSVLLHILEKVLESTML
jgi:hypothetical protein